MNARAILAIARKDLKVVSQNKNIITPLIIIAAVFFIVYPWVTSLIPTLLHGFGGTVDTLEGVLAKMPGSIQFELAGYTVSQQLFIVLLVYMMLPLFLLIPMMIASMFAADSFAGEKERKTLEALLYTPTTDRELFIAKMLSGWLASLVLALVVFVVYAINVNAAAWSQMHRIFFPNALWVVMVLWVVPALAGLGVSLMVVVSAKAQGFQDANQMAGLVVLPILALFTAQMAGAILLNTIIMFLMGLFVWLLAGVLIWLGSRSFHRNRLLAG